MARISWLAFPAALLLIFGSCGPSDMKEPEVPGETQKQGNPSQVKQEVLADVWETVVQKSAAEPKLPRDLETGDRYLTARVTADADGYEVVYYLMDEPVPLNDPALKKEAPYLTAGAIVHDSAEGARAGVNYEPEVKTGQHTDLGHGITGYTDAGARSTRIVWHEGNWSFLVHQRNGERAGEEMKEQATEMVEKLEKQMLPPTQEVGAGTFDMTGNGVSANSIQWQAENIVYSIHFGEALELIDIVAKMNE